MSNYPIGVTGNEPQIAGYPEAVMIVTCTDCELEDELDVFIDGVTVCWDCPECGYSNAVDMEFDYEDPSNL